MLFVMQHKNDNTAFHRNFAVSVALALKSDVTAVPNCEKRIHHVTCLKARKNLCDTVTVGYFGGKYLVLVDADN